MARAWEPVSPGPGVQGEAWFKLGSSGCEYRGQRVVGEAKKGVWEVQRPFSLSPLRSYLSKPSDWLLVPPSYNSPF